MYLLVGFVAFGLFSCNGNDPTNSKPASQHSDSISAADSGPSTGAFNVTNASAPALPSYIATTVAVGAESNLLVGDKVYAELDVKMEGSDVGFESQPYFLIERSDKKLMALNTDITPYVSGKRTIVPGNVVAEADSNTVTTETTSINLNLYNLKGANFALTVFGVKLYVIRDGARLDLTIPAFASWINAAAFPKVNQPSVAAVNETSYEISAKGYMSANIVVGAASNLMVGDELYAELDATFTGIDAGYETQPFLVVQGQDKTFLTYNTDINPYVSGVRTVIPGTVPEGGSTNTITQGISSVYVNVYNVKGSGFNVTANGVRLFALRGATRVQVVLPPLSEFTQVGTVATSVATPVMPVISGVLVRPRPENKIAQRNILANWPRLPQKYSPFDWQQRTKDFTNFVFDWNKQSNGATIVWNADMTNYKKGGVFTLPDYYGDVRVGYHNLFTNTAAVFSASLAGMDMSSVTYEGQTYNYVDQLSAYYHPQTNIMTLEPSQPGYGAWWFDVISNLMYYGLGDMYPGEGAANGMNARLKGIAETYYKMIVKLGGAKVDWDYNGFDHVNGKPVLAPVGLNTMDAGLGVAVVEYYAYKKFGDVRYLTAAKWALDYYERSAKSRFFDNYAHFGTYIAARINAETGSKYNATKYIDWVLAINAANLGVFQTSFDGFDYFGSAGFKYSYGKKERTYFYETAQYAFMLPAVKYDARLALPIAKWMLNASDNAKYFFADQLTPAQQPAGVKYNASERFIPYEAIEVQSKEGVSHFGESDNYRWKTDPNYTFITDMMGPNCSYLSIYSGVWTGLWGGIVRNTNVNGIIQLDVNKLDFYSKSYPTYLYYNPYLDAKQLKISLSKPSDLYDVISGKFLAQNVSGEAAFAISPDSVVLLVVAPARSARTYVGNKTLLNGVVVAYQKP